MSSICIKENCKINNEDNPKNSPQTDDHITEENEHDYYVDNSDDDSDEKSETSEEDNDYFPFKDEYESDVNWDSDDYWEPSCNDHIFIYSREKAWNIYVTKRMESGCFCPADIHPPKLKSAPRNVETIPGQFDNVSSDEEKC